MTPADPEQGSSAAAASGSEPLSCVSCRSRKLKCDKLRPACTRCTKVDADCVYPESRRKPAFKRRNVRELEERLGPRRRSVQISVFVADQPTAQVECMLMESQDDKKAPSAAAPHAAPHAAPGAALAGLPGMAAASSTPGLNANAAPDIPIFGTMDWNADMANLMNSSLADDSQSPEDVVPMTVPMRETDALPDPYNSLIDLGMFEALPPFEVLEELSVFQPSFASLSMLTDALGTISSSKAKRPLYPLSTAVAISKPSIPPRTRNHPCASNTPYGQWRPTATASTIPTMPSFIRGHANTPMPMR
jgi:hypothetical protein